MFNNKYYICFLSFNFSSPAPLPETTSNYDVESTLSDRPQFLSPILVTGRMNTGYTAQTTSSPLALEGAKRAPTNYGSATYTYVIEGCLNNYLIKKYTEIGTILRCAAKCSFNKLCKSFNFVKEIDTCHINSKAIADVDSPNISLQGICINYQKTSFSR